MSSIPTAPTDFKTAFDLEGPRGYEVHVSTIYKAEKQFVCSTSGLTEQLGFFSYCINEISEYRENVS